MPKKRLVFHPILSHPYSRFLFYIFFTISLVVGGYVWWRVNGILELAEISFTDPNLELTSFQYVLFSPFLRGALIFVAALIGAAFSAHLMVGPIKRIENWIMVLHTGRPVKELRVRDNDKFAYLSVLLNTFHERITSHKGKKAA